MAGHSKWANIKHRKGAQDKKRAKIFTRLIKEIMVAVKEGGDDPDANPRLRMAMKNASKASVPKDKIQNALSKGSGEGDDYVETTFEGYAPNGVAVFVEATTDNNNRTVANVRAAFNKTNGSLGKSGSVDYMFERKGIFLIKAEDLQGRDLEELQLELMDAGMEEWERDDEHNVVVTTAFEDFGSLNAKLEELEVEAESSTLERIPTTTVELDIEGARQVMRLIDRLEDDDDVQNVFHNLEMTDEIEAALEEE